MEPIDLIESAYLKKDLAQFQVGDLIRVYVKIKEEEKLRIQAFEGTVIKRQGRGLRATFTMHKVSYGEGIERTFLLHSPSIDKIEVVRRGKARRAKLYYLRGKKGKQAKVV